MVWSLESGVALQTLKGHSDTVSSVVITPDGKRVVSGSADHTLKVWDLQSGHELRTLEGHSDTVRAMAVTPDGTRAPSASNDRTLKLWDLESEQIIASIDLDGELYACAAAPDGRTVVAGGASGQVHILRLIEPETGKGAP